MSNENETIIPENYKSDMADIDESIIPQIITEKINRVAEIDVKINELERNADYAKKKAEEAKQQKVNFLGGGKDAIMSLQDSAVETNNVVFEIANVQKLTLELLQQQESNIKDILMLGVSNLANNRCVIKELENKLNGANEGELSEMRQQEIFDLIKELKAQQDFMEKQQRMSGTLKEHDESISTLENNDIKLSKILERKNEIDERQDKDLKQQAQTDKRHDAILKKQEGTNKRLGNELRSRVEKDREHDAELETRAEIDKRHDEALSELAVADKIHTERIDELEKYITSLKSKIKILYAIIAAGFGMGLIAIVLVLIS
jgi:hypothetical protein